MTVFIASPAVSSSSFCNRASWAEVFHFDETRETFGRSAEQAIDDIAHVLAAANEFIKICTVLRASLPSGEDVEHRRSCTPVARQMLLDRLDVGGSFGHKTHNLQLQRRQVVTFVRAIGVFSVRTYTPGREPLSTNFLGDGGKPTKRHSDISTFRRLV